MVIFKLITEGCEGVGETINRKIERKDCLTEGH